MPARSLPPSDLPHDQSAILLRVYNGWWPHVPAFGRPQTAQWAGRSYAGTAISLSITAGELSGLVSMQAQSRPEIDEWPTLGSALNVDFDDGSRLIASHILTHNVSIQNSPTQATVQVTFSAMRWTWNRDTGTIPVVWLLSMSGPDPGVALGTADLQVNYVRDDELVTGGSSWQPHLLGTARAFLLQRRIAKHLRAWCIAIVEPVDIEKWLLNDWLALKITLGRQLEAQQIIGLASDGRVVRIVGRSTSTRRDLRGKQREGIPLHTLYPEVEKFYSCLCNAEGIADQLREPVAMYVDSVGDSVQGEYLKIRTALTLLSRVAQPEFTRMIYINVLLSELGKVADEMRPSVAARWAARQDAALVEQAIRQFVPDFVSAVEPALVSTPDEHVDLTHRKLERLIEEVAICRTLFFALLGSLVGYHGLILHWQRADDSEYRTYRLGLEAEAERSRFHITATLPIEDLAFQAWPVFEAPSLPKHPTLRTLDSFAAALEQRAGGAVRASLQVQPEEAEGNHYDFKIMLVRAPSIQATIFSVIEKDGSMTIEGWPEDDEPLEIDNPRILNEFMERVAKSATIRRLVERYMIFDSELSRGER